MRISSAYILFFLNLILIFALTPFSERVGQGRLEILEPKNINIC